VHTPGEGADGDGNTCDLLSECLLQWLFATSSTHQVTGKRPLVEVGCSSSSSSIIIDKPNKKKRGKKKEIKYCDDDFEDTCVSETMPDPFVASEAANLSGHIRSALIGLRYSSSGADAIDGALLEHEELALDVGLDASRVVGMLVVLETKLSISEGPSIVQLMLRRFLDYCNTVSTELQICVNALVLNKTAKDTLTVPLFHFSDPSFNHRPASTRMRDVIRQSTWLGWAAATVVHGLAAYVLSEEGVEWKRLCVGNILDDITAVIGKMATMTPHHIPGVEMSDVESYQRSITFLHLCKAFVHSVAIDDLSSLISFLPSVSDPLQRAFYSSMIAESVVIFRNNRTLNSTDQSQDILLGEDDMSTDDICSLVMDALDTADDDAFDVDSRTAFLSDSRILLDILRYKYDNFQSTSIIINMCNSCGPIIADVCVVCGLQCADADNASQHVSADADASRCGEMIVALLAAKVFTCRLSIR
jgi:hypothetical protein